MRAVDAQKGGSFILVSYCTSSHIRYFACCLSPIPQIRYPEELPISARREEIIAGLRSHQVLIIAGETGSGKTTQLPKMCLEAGLALRGKIGCTQPRRVAALSISRRVAEELGVTWGREVGCKMRFNDDTGRSTRIKFMTDGILLAEIQSDPNLHAYSALILDEAHERSLNIDFLLGYLQGLLKRRPDLKLIVTSATIDTEAFSQAFGGAPVIEVSGRLWPVEIRYMPIENKGIDDEDTGYIEAAVRATEDALIETDDGDLLVFMPTERDIRDTRELLEARLGSGIEVLGLFGRMPAAEQQRIFAPGPRRRVVVATNIAETSLTLPRIRYVIDAGLSRMSRYNPRTRTRRLPVEEISQSSANQRAGRAGRLRDGICIRLYSREDFEKRPRFTQPEIQRSNLAEVILRMKAFRLGEIESFPFLNPPPDSAIRAGYQLLHELGALDDEHRMTEPGRELARLPIDPTLGRMLLQSRKENALPEILIIAAGLSVPDPRERPDEQKEAAAAAHKAFGDSDSDFISLLKIWRASPPVGTGSSNNALRRFCKTNFLSQARMREWRDIYRQLAEAMSDGMTGAMVKQSEATYEAIHRSILAGQLGHIALREERNTYKASGNRLVTVFPGSGLYERREKPRKSQPKPEAVEKIRQPHWIVAGEIVQTSQLFARMIARIDPLWVIELGEHLCKFRYTEPHWSSRAGRVLVSERTLIHGMELRKRHVDYGRINPGEATEIFIRGALVAGEVHLTQRFFEENRRLRDKIETGLTRVRSRRVLDLDGAFYEFYAQHIEGVSSVHDLNKLVRSRIGNEPDFLCATEAALMRGDGHDYDRTLFPDNVLLGNTALPVSYAYDPGDERDGVTLRVPLPVAEQLSTSQLQWMVPGLREEQMGVLLRALPKSLRRPLMPLEPKARELSGLFQPGSQGFLETLAALITKKYGVPVSAKDWPAETLPQHLCPRIEIVDATNKVIATGRNLDAIQEAVRNKGGRSREWDAAIMKWERPAITSWSFGDLPESIVVEMVAGAPVPAYPGLALRDGEVDVRLFRKREQAEKSSQAGVRRLAELTLARDLAWLWKQLRTLSPVQTSDVNKATNMRDLLEKINPSIPQLKNAGDGRGEGDGLLQESAFRHIINHSLTLDPVYPLTESRFKILLETARRELPALTHRVCELISQALALRRKILASSNRYAGMEQDITRLLPPDFPSQVPHPQLSNVCRFLRAVQIRAERAMLNPARDAEKAKQLLPFTGSLQSVTEDQRESFHWMLEEFRVSIFAQELGTAVPVSAQRLKAFTESQKI